MLKKIIKYFLMDNHIQIRSEYLDYISSYSSEEHVSFYLKFLKLLKLNFKYRIQHYLMRHVHLPVLSPEYIFDYALDYDVISFDIFDTLLFRLVNNPYDVFLIMESKYHFKYFSTLRISSEVEARRKNTNNLNQEISLREIYEVFAEKCVIDPREWQKKEIETELSLLVPNYKMKQILDKLAAADKTIVLTSDMYLPAEILEEFICFNGYKNIKRIFVSSDYGCSKKEGDLYKKVRECFPKEKILHIGDNKHSDVRKPRCYHIDSIHWALQSETMLSNKTISMGRLQQSIYYGLNRWMMSKNGSECSEYFDYGFANGGILVCGYCQWLNNLAREKNIEKILFLSRDCYILHEVYNLHFKRIDNDYVYFSRFCADQILFQNNIEEYIKKNIRPRFYASSLMTFKDLLLQLDLMFLERELDKYNLSLSEKLSHDNYDSFRRLFMNNKEFLLKEMQKTQYATLQYLKRKTKGKKRILVVDVGWYASGYTAIKHLLEDDKTTSFQVYGALLGTREGYNVEAMMANGHLRSYCFSPMHNTELLHWHNSTDAVIHDALVEILFTSPEPSFLKYVFEENGKITPIFSSPEQNDEIISEIHNGIKEFVSMYVALLSRLSWELYISGKDAYIPIMSTMKKKRFCYELFANYKTTSFSGDYRKEALENLGDIMHKEHYI